MIVSVSSVAGKVGSQQRSGYSGSKHAVVGFMDCLRAEVFKFGIKVLVACPGWVQTNISLNALNGKGEPENVMDETIANGITAEACAEEIIKGILLEKDELIIGKGISGFAPLIKRFLPGLVNRIMRNKVYR
jgi:short-subunit dehydrogenase